MSRKNRDQPRRMLGDVALELRAIACTARGAILSASALSTRDIVVLELAQAIVLLTNAAARFDQSCGYPDPSGIGRSGWKT